jgi:hypothetical protein
MGFEGLGDRVAVRHVKAPTMDSKKFHQRLEELETAGTLTEPSDNYVSALIGAWRRKDNDDDD